MSADQDNGRSCGEAAQEVTALLRDWRRGNEQARDELISVVYAHLRRLAASAAASERSGHTLSPTALVHEAFLRLTDADIDWNDRDHFFSLAARLMRRILVDYARASRRGKRGGAAVRVTLGRVADMQSSFEELLEIDEALSSLERMDKRKAELIELLYFAGATQPEAARMLGVSESTIARELKVARAWLRREILQGRPS